MAPALHAGYVEISAQGSYRSTNVDEFNYSLSQSGTASIAYYFWEMSAIELSYTLGVAKVFGRDDLARKNLTTVEYNSLGADLVIALAGREAPFRPYVKFGAARLVRSQKYEVEGVQPTAPITKEGVSPSAGLGFRILLGQGFSFKFGLDAAPSPTENSKIDLYGNAGISFLF